MSDQESITWYYSCFKNDNFTEGVDLISWWFLFFSRSRNLTENRGSDEQTCRLTGKTAIHISCGRLELKSLFNFMRNAVKGSKQIFRKHFEGIPKTRTNHQIFLLPSPSDKHNLIILINKSWVLVLGVLEAIVRRRALQKKTVTADLFQIFGLFIVD